AATDPLFQLLRPARQVFQWHGETFSLPVGARLLATHPDVPYQVFRLNEGQYGLQFHLEADAELIEQWIAFGENERQALGPEGLARIRREHASFMASAHALCRAMLDAWLKLIETRG
ncbi:MAG: type 1 glutamine amidotransferase, partial [Mariprofundaceae bacterium]